MELVPKANIVRAGDAFLFSAENLYQNKPKEIDWMIPFYVNCGLALELYFKAYLSDAIYVSLENNVKLVTSKSKFKFHSLVDLYEEINCTIKNDLNERFYLCNELTSEFASLKDALMKYDNVFIQMRYVHELNVINLGSTKNLILLVNFIQTAIYDIGTKKL
ncbi:TPA: hypothetical protein I7206_13935 [Vibrio vulnificus]|nr:hypothetical protein [Vibrio vulnificus]